MDCLKRPVAIVHHGLVASACIAVGGAAFTRRSGLQIAGSAPGAAVGCFITRRVGGVADRRKVGVRRQSLRRSWDVVMCGGR